MKDRVSALTSRAIIKMTTYEERRFRGLSSETVIRLRQQHIKDKRIIDVKEEGLLPTRTPLFY
jgi:hypothetical protein